MFWQKFESIIRQEQTFAYKQLKPINTLHRIQTWVGFLDNIKKLFFMVLHFSPFPDKLFQWKWNNSPWYVCIFCYQHSGQWRMQHSFNRVEMQNEIIMSICPSVCPCICVFPIILRLQKICCMQELVLILNFHRMFRNDPPYSGKGCYVLNTWFISSKLKIIQIFVRPESRF